MCRHICGHASFGDRRLLLQRKNLWCDDASEYLSSILDHCPYCHAESKPQNSRKVSIANVSTVQRTVCIDHLFLGGERIFHAMDASPSYSPGLVYDTTSIESRICTLETVWIAPFWAPSNIKGDQAFNNPTFPPFCDTIVTPSCLCLPVTTTKMDWSLSTVCTAPY